MKTLTYKTNINCSGCVARVTPGLNAVQDVKYWFVDIKNPGKILTVKTLSDDDSGIISAVEKAGFEIHRTDESVDA
ncbi:MAG: heavy-metal-associated domain-containing protein [Ignavibacteriaceae bacterium]|nr:heavy-metal-associated domain-containing protein [Ignavibacteriaceae bacterium]